jgi:predicted DNA-binding protein with PD1-like motif
LRCAPLRYAGRSETTRLEQKLEIVSLVGTLSRHGCHLHIALADENGQVRGGHLMDQSRIYTTAEIVLGIIPGISFRRAPDPVTGYQELLVTPTDAGSAMPQAGIYN